MTTDGAVAMRIAVAADLTSLVELAVAFCDHLGQATPAPIEAE
jgi:hypothetical protein